MGKSNTRETFGRRAFSTSEQEQISNTYNINVIDGTFVFGPPKNDKERLLNQVNYWVANDNLVKARMIMKSLGFPSRMIKAYINDEQDLQKEKPEVSGYYRYKNKPMPETFKVVGN